MWSAKQKTWVQSLGWEDSLEGSNPTDRGAWGWGVTVHGVTKLGMTEQLRSSSVSISLYRHHLSIIYLHYTLQYGRYWDNDNE